MLSLDSDEDQPDHGSCWPRVQAGPRTDDRRLVPRDKGPRAGLGRVEAKRRNASEEAREDGEIMPLFLRGNLVGIYSRGKREREGS